MKIIISDNLKNNIINIINKTYNTDYAISNIKEMIFNTTIIIVTMNNNSTFKINYKNMI